MLSLCISPSFDDWRAAARRMLLRQVEPAAVFWTDSRNTAEMLPELCNGIEIDHPASGKLPTVPAQFVGLARLVALHRDPDRWSFLYRILWRLTHGEPQLLKLTTDDDVDRLLRMHKLIRRDIHKMHAFVRFRLVMDAQGEHFIAWHRPDHFIVPEVGPWFARRFAAMRWSILTPDDSVSWDGHQLCFAPGVPVSTAPRVDELEELWKTYYASIFNPARIKINAMKKEMPVRHWATLPEAQLIDDLLRNAAPRVENMMRHSTDQEKPAARSAAAFIPAKLELPVLAKAAAKCQGCDLYCHATQVVFGEGPETASVMFVGEQPGDKEDLAGAPFVGPAGKMLNTGLEEAGIDRSTVYVTNAVKHFKFEQQGVRRIHAKPNAREMAACRPWLEAEIATVRPKLIVCLGATAAQSLMGPQFRITRDRGKIFTDQEWAPALVATNHPAAILRVPDPAGREAAYQHFVQDLKLVNDRMAMITRGQADESAKKHAHQTVTGGLFEQGNP